jgi:hypothetical protein
MTDYNYQTGKFSDKDSLPPGDPNKIVRGQDFEDEFPDIETAVNSKLNSANPIFTGILQGPTITISGTMTAGLIDGGFY